MDGRSYTASETTFTHSKTQGAGEVAAGGINPYAGPPRGPRSLLRLANEASFGQLEQHLREYIRHIPFRPAPTYAAPGAQPPEPQFSHRRTATFNADAAFSSPRTFNSVGAMARWELEEMEARRREQERDAPRSGSRTPALSASHNASFAATSNFNTSFGSSQLYGSVDSTTLRSSAMPGGSFAASTALDAASMLPPSAYSGGPYHEQSAVGGHRLVQSPAFRFTLQRLAMDIHGPQELSRRPIEYDEFARHLGAPDGEGLELLDPQVEDRRPNSLASVFASVGTDAANRSFGGAAASDAVRQAAIANAAAADAATAARRREIEAAMGDGAGASSSFVAQRLAAAQRRGVQLTMSPRDVRRELAHLDMEERVEAGMTPEQRWDALKDRSDRANRGGPRAASAVSGSGTSAAAAGGVGRRPVVNMYDLRDPGLGAVGCNHVAVPSWRNVKSTYF